MSTTKLIDAVICPACGEGLFDNTEGISCERGHVFAQNNHAFADLTFPQELTGNDKLFYEQYTEIAEFYDKAAKQLFAMHGGDQDRDRSNMVEVAGLQPAFRVLEISTGTGLNIPHILDRIGSEGQLTAIDLSPSMLEVARRKFEDVDNVEFYLCNASHLPFASGSFDAVIHVGGINTFTDKGRAISEMQRVVKTGGKVMISDEGMGPWNLNTDYGKALLGINGLYKDQPPLELLPLNIEDVKLSWVLGNVFYVLEWTKRDAPPVLNTEAAQFDPSR